LLTVILNEVKNLNVLRINSAKDLKMLRVNSVKNLKALIRVNASEGSDFKSLSDGREILRLPPSPIHPSQKHCFGGQGLRRTSRLRMTGKVFYDGLKIKISRGLCRGKIHFDFDFLF